MAMTTMDIFNTKYKGHLRRGAAHAIGHNAEFNGTGPRDQGTCHVKGRVNAKGTFFGSAIISLTSATNEAMKLFHTFSLCNKNTLVGACITTTPHGILTNQRWARDKTLGTKCSARKQLGVFLYVVCQRCACVRFLLGSCLVLFVGFVWC